MAHLPIWYMGAITPEQCDKVIAELSALPMRDAAMGSDGEITSHDYRNTSVRFAPHDYWLASDMILFAHEANKQCAWEYEVNSAEAIQFASYGPEQHYNWHVDNFPLSGRPIERKLTVVILLSDPAEFEGGEFQMRLYGEFVAPLVKGSMIAFPSILEHRVTPVLAGLRRSATIWLSGPRFK